MKASDIRILVVLPMYGGSLPIGKYCFTSLKKLGYNTRCFDSQVLYSGYKGISELNLSPNRIQNLQNSFLRLVSQSIWNMIEEQGAQIVLALAQAPIDMMLLKKLRQEKILTVMWFVEDFQVFNYWRVFAPLYDAFAVIQKEPFLSQLNKIGQKNAFYLPLAALPEFHKPEKLNSQEQKEFGSDISFFGAGYPNRRIAFRPLKNKDFKIWGSDWEGEEVLKPNLQRNGKRIDEYEGKKIYNASKINLNLHSNIDYKKLVGHGDFVNPRTFELASCGAFQLVDKRSLMDELFAPDELATFENIEEFYEKINYFLKNPDEREKYVKKARERVLKFHTYELRMIQLLNYLENNFKVYFSAWEGKNKNISHDISPELKKELEILAKKLGLSINSSFSEILSQLRLQQGVLTGLETSLLFLDEWQKQYSSK